METGLIFDIKEFAINDGPGIRLTVFLKGCALRCKWCHNPEGLSFEPQLNLKTKKLTGKIYTSEELIKHIYKFKDVFDSSSGGVTFSGGEPTAQPQFLIEVLQNLNGIHKNIDTSGFCENKIFEEIVKYTDLVFFDLKLIDCEKHKLYTGVSNELILQNLKILSNSERKYNIRIPLIPDITDTRENLDDIIELIYTLKNKPTNVDLLPYNKLAGAKYPTYDMIFPLKDRKKENNMINIDNFKMNLRRLYVKS